MKNENLKNELKEVLNNRKTLGQSNNVRTSPLSVGDTILISAKTCSREKTAPLNGNIYQYFMLCICVIRSDNDCCNR